MNKLPFRILKEAKNLKGKRVILRLDLNLPTEGGVIQNDFRLRRAIPTMEFLKNSGAKIIVISHTDAPEYGLKPIARYLNKTTSVGFVPSVTGPLVRSAVSQLSDGGAVVLENLRTDKGEEKNSFKFAKELASMADIYVNEDFATSHRRHASIVSLPELLPSYAGLLFEEEYRHLRKFLKPRKPFFFILGGAKLETKIPLIKRYLPVAFSVFIGGALANSFFKTKGYEMGKSVVGKLLPDINFLLKNKKILLPTDVRILSGSTISPRNLSSKDKIVDIGPMALAELKKKISKAKSVLFNGPVGIYNEGFGWGTEEILKLLAKSKAEIVLGGGDTLAVVSKLKLENKFSFVSTAGGAMLEFLAEGTLPGIEALKKKRDQS